METVHLAPSPTTIKRLYGSAVSCAYPACTEPLYKVESGSSTPVRNSEVAHVCARRVGGPRWRPMTPGDNAGFDNLILLCAQQHAVVDDAAGRDRFTEEKLLQWKADQLRTAAGAGTPISDEEARQISIEMTVDSPTSVVATNLHVGGAGGAAPGAGGGGGGAIGMGAVGGPGGPAGSVGRIDLDGRPGSAPGAGGGGGGSIDLAAIALAANELQLDVAGQGGVYGIDGGPGGATTITDASGATLLHAEGGAPGLAVSSERREDGEIRVSTFLLGDYFRTEPGGLVTAVAAAWSSLTVLNLPGDVIVPVFAVFEAGGNPAGSYTMLIEAINTRGRCLGRLQFPLTVDHPGRLLRVPFHAPLSVTVDEYGLWRFVVSAAAGEIAEHPLLIKRA